MYTRCAGTLLSPYAVYKAANMYDTWIQGGAQGVRFNCSNSGWFDQVCFNDWFMETALPHLKNLGGNTVMTGNNLSSHFSVEVGEKRTTSAYFLPANSTHMTYLTQPLDLHLLQH